MTMARRITVLMLSAAVAYAGIRLCASAAPSVSERQTISHERDGGVCALGQSC